jgi:hypothetical protein
LERRIFTMSNKPAWMKPENNKARPAQVSGRPGQLNVNINQLEPMCCGGCGSLTFVQMISVRYLPALQSPNGQPGTVFMPAGVACTQCGTENDAKPVSVFQKEKEDEETKAAEYELQTGLADAMADDPKE